MTDTPDADLLEQFACARSGTAFTTLVERHLGLVHSVALRHTANPQHAQDIAQAVFIILARKAATLSRQTILAGWLYHTARLTAANFQRSENRRVRREQEAFMQSTLHEPAPEAPWTEMSPLLDEAMSHLSAPDRDALVLRYFQNKTLPEVGAALGLAERTAQKRVLRAVEKLRKFFAKRGLPLSAAAIVGAISANSVQAVPAGLAAAIAITAISGTTLNTAAVIAATKAIAMTALQKILITATIIAAVGAGIYEARQNSRLREQNVALQQRQIPLAAQLEQLQAENAQLSNQVARAKDQKSLSQTQLTELLKLRGQTGQTRTALQELAKMRAAPPAQVMPAYLTNAMASGIAMIEKFRKKAALERLDRMKEKLGLTDDQQQAISDIMMKQIEGSSQQLLAATSAGKNPPANLAVIPNADEAAIKSLLTPDQLAAYPAFQQSETLVAAEASAKSSLSMMAGEINLTPDEQDRVHAALVQLNLDNAANPSSNRDAAPQASASGDFVAYGIQVQKQKLADELQALDGILTPDQLQTYQQKRTDMLDMQSNAIKMFLPSVTNTVAQ